MAHAVTSMGPILLVVAFVMEPVSQLELTQTQTALLVIPIARTSMYAIQQANVTIHLPRRAASPSTVA